MNKNKIKLFRTIVIAGIAFGINYFINFFLTPYITDNIGTEAYGFVTLTKTFASYVLIVTTALNSYASRFITVAYHTKDFKRVNTYFNSVLFSNIIFGILLLFLLFIGIKPIMYLIKVPKELYFDVGILFFLVFLNLAITCSTTAFQSFSYIKNKLDIASAMKGFSYFIEACILLLTYFFFAPKVMYVGLGLCGASVMLLLGNIILTRKYIPEIKVTINYYDFSAVKELVFNGIWNSLNSLGNVLNSGLDLLVCTTLLSPIAMGQLSIAKGITSIISGIFQMTSTPFHPIFLKSYADGNKEKLIKQLVYSIKISGMISNIFFAAFFALGLSYYKLWIPNQNIQLIYWLTVISIFSGVLEGAVYPLYYIYTLTVKNKIPCIITILGGILNVAGMYLLINYTDLGIFAVVLTTAIIMTFINGVSNPLYMSFCLNISPLVIYKPLFMHLISCFCMTVSFVCVANCLVINSWKQFILLAIILTAIGIAIHIFLAFGLKKLIYIIQKKW
nr:oligosaccharide flippase family protein [uncultured Butyrivibrio sp.]